MPIQPNQNQLCRPFVSKLELKGKRNQIRQILITIWVAKVNFCKIFSYFYSISTAFCSNQGNFVDQLMKISTIAVEIITRIFSKRQKKTSSQSEKLQLRWKNFSVVGKTSSTWEKLHRLSRSILMKFFRPPCK